MKPEAVTRASAAQGAPPAQHGPGPGRSQREPGAGSARRSIGPPQCMHGAVRTGPPNQLCSRPPPPVRSPVNCSLPVVSLPGSRNVHRRSCSTSPTAAAASRRPPARRAATCSRTGSTSSPASCRHARVGMEGRGPGGGGGMLRRGLNFIASRQACYMPSGLHG